MWLWLTLRHRPGIPFRAGHAAADGVWNAFGHRKHREVSVEAQAVAAQGAPGLFIETEGMEVAAEAGLEVCTATIRLAGARLCS